MTTLVQAVHSVLEEQRVSQKPLAVILAGHNGSGKSTLWYGNNKLADEFKIPLINADRMMVSILPEQKPLPLWASTLRDNNPSWMQVAQKGVEAFVAQAMQHKVPFAMETVFSHWKDLGGGRFESKIDRIRELQVAGYFVLLLFVGLSDVQLSIARVATRVASGGHSVATRKLEERFPRTQKAIKHAVTVADAAILMDNSSEASRPFTVCRVQIGDKEIYNCRHISKKKLVSYAILNWLSVVSPMP